jgi:hypothetical protein
MLHHESTKYGAVLTYADKHQEANDFLADLHAQV